MTMKRIPDELHSFVSRRDWVADSMSARDDGRPTSECIGAANCCTLINAASWLFVRFNKPGSMPLFETLMASRLFVYMLWRSIDFGAVGMKFAISCVES